MKKIALLLIGISISFVNFSQNLITTEISSIEEIEACQTENFSVSIDKISGSYTSTDTIIIEMGFPGSIHFVNAVLSSGSLSVDNGNPENPICTISGVTGSSIGFNYTVSATCDLISASISSALTNTLAISLNGSTDHTAFSTSYNVLSPWLVFDNAGSTNLNYSLGQFNVPIERTFKYINTSSTDFTGDFLFVDTIEVDFINSGVQLQNIELLFPLSGVDILKTVTDSSIYYTVAISNLSQGDSLVFKESIYLIDCSSGGIDNSVTRFNSSYGCSNGTFCQSIEAPAFVTTTSFDPNDKPQIELELLTRGYETCWTDPQERLVKITNTGTGDASDVRMRFLGGLQNSITTMDLSTIEFFKKPAAVEIPVNYITIDFFGTGQSQFFDSAYSSNEILAAGDSIFIRYYELINCIDTSEYDTYFNEGIFMHREYPDFYLEHPCNSTNSLLSSAYGWRQWEHIFKLQQNFENLNGTILDDEELWYEIDNTTTLFIGKEYLGNKFFYNADSSEIQVRLTIEPGLGLVGDSIYMCSPQGSNNVKLFPYQVDYAQGDGINTGTGDVAVAHFRIPDNYYGDYPPNYWNGDLHYSTTEYYKFFNNFKVKFKLKAYCQYTTGERVSITEEFFFIPNTDCPIDCKLPISKVSDKVAVHCPGCIVPGWNLSSFNIERINLDYADDDNNNYPDSYPFELTQADPNLAETRHVMLGDTIECAISAFTSNGEQLLFSNIGFDYDEGQLLMKGDFLQHLEFIGATGSFTNSNGTEPFTIPPSAGVFWPNGFTIDLGIDALVNNYGIPSSFINRFWGGNTITIVPKFVVKDNLINGTGGDPYYSVEQIDASINMSGTPYSGIDIKLDSKGTHIDSIIAMDSISRSEMNYWCTGYDGRIVGVGSNFYYQQTLTNYYQFNPCYKTINAKMYSDVGQSFIGGYGDQGGTQTAWNSFSYELRNLWLLDSTTINFPDYLEIERIEFKLTQLISDTTNNLTKYNGNFYSSNTTHIYDLNDANFGDSSITIYPARNFQELTNSFYNQPDRFTGYDETKRYRMYAVLKMKDCQNTPDIIPVGTSYPLVTHWSDFPGATNGDTTLTNNMSGNYQFDMPSAEIETQILPLIQNATNADLSWDINLSSAIKTNTYTYGVINERAENSFLYFISPSGNISVDELLWRSNNSPVPIVDSINGIPLFGLGMVGANWSAGWVDAEITANASFDCSNITDTDSLIVITGWNCYGYPTSIEDACYTDTTIMYITPEQPGMQAQLEVQDIVNACDTLNYNLELKATGLGNVENVNIRLNLPTGGELSYLAGSGMVSFDGSSTNIDPSVDSLGFYWNLDSVNFMTNNFNGLNPEAYLTFDVKSSCGFNDEQVELEISGNNYCGKPIGPFNLERIPSVIEGIPTLDSLNLNITASTMEPCSDSTLITMTIVNVGTKVTGEFNTLELILPDDFTYLSGDIYTAVNGNTLTYNLSNNIPIGGTQTISFYGVNTAPVNCDVYPLSGNVYVGDEYYCDVVLCFLEGGQSSVISFATNIVIEDTNPPVIIGVPSDLTVSCDNIPVTPAVTVNDNCGASLEYVETTENGSCPNNYTVTKTWTATDDCGNITIATQVITVVDNEIPVIDCPADIYLSAGDSIATWGLSATDNCGLDQLYSSIPSGFVFPVGTTTVEITAIDGCGNTSTCSFDVTRVPPLVVDAGPCQTVYFGYGPLACTDLNASLITSSSGPYTYTWSNGETGSTITVCPTVTTIYTVTVTDGNGFSSTADVVLNVIDASCGNNGNKVVVCHIPPGNPNNVQEICIAQQAVGAHIDPAYGHSGCRVGLCDFVDPCDPFGNKSMAVNNNSHVREARMITSIYPNPNKGQFTIHLAERINLVNTEIEIYNMMGKLIKRITPNEFIVEVNLSEESLESAMYFVKIISDDDLEVQKVVIEE